MQYIRIYADDGYTRITFSSGLRSKEAARVKFEALLSDPAEIDRIRKEYEVRKQAREDGKQLAHTAPSKPNQKKESDSSRITFAEFAANWWLWDRCPYVLAKRSRGTAKHPGIKRTTVDTNRMWTERYLIPILGCYRMKELSPSLIDEKLLTPLKTEKGLAPKTCNNIRAILMTMMKNAVMNGLLDQNPVEYTLPFKEDERIVQLFTLEEIKELFSWNNFEELWNGNWQYYTINLLATFTGMRQGELRALKRSDIGESFIVVNKGYTKFGEDTTKTSETRTIPIPEELRKLLIFVSSLTPDCEYIFSIKGSKPIGSGKCRLSLYSAMDKIGITESERKRRNLTFHSLRHFFTTYCVTENIANAKIKSVTGHKSLEMLDRYTDLSTKDLQEITSAQEELTAQIFVATKGEQEKSLAKNQCHFQTKKDFQRTQAQDLAKIR